MDYEEERSPALPKALVPLAPLLILALALLLWQRKRSDNDRVFGPILSAIDDADIPDPAKSILRTSVSEVRDAVSAIRGATSKIADLR